VCGVCLLLHLMLLACPQASPLVALLPDAQELTSQLIAPPCHEHHLCLMVEVERCHCCFQNA
jgi:hypothetical protein